MKRKRILGINTHFVIYLLLTVVVALLIPPLLLLVNGPAFRQKPDQVVIREPGKRFLGVPTGAGPEARDDLPFALLSQAVYQKPPDILKIKEGKALDPDATLRDMGWRQWEDFPNGDLQKTIDDVHLRLQVWSNRELKEVVVTFGGTVFRNLKDWKSDLRWFIPHQRDEYTVIVKDFGREFVKEYHRRQDLPGWEFLRESEIFSTGHSLGGGLAQQFAYSQPEDATLHPVTKVYAFDPSPVTGFFSVDKGLRDYNRKDLKIDRIYERGEILAIFRSFTHFVAPPAARAPEIRQVRYNLFYTRNPFAGHSMAEFAFQMYNASGPKKAGSVP